MSRTACRTILAFLSLVFVLVLALHSQSPGLPSTRNGDWPHYTADMKGMLYTTGGTRRYVVALDGKTGEVIWTHSLREGRRAAVSPRQLSGRGVSYWTDGKGDERIVYVSTGYRLVELNAKTGTPVP